MAWVLNLFHGSTTVNLVNDSGIKVLREDFRPTVGPDKTETGITTDSYRAFINASSVATLQGFIRSANYAFLMARERQLRNAGDRVYMNVAVDGDSTEYRSEVLDGDVIPDGIYNPNWSNGEAWVTLMITRRNWFEGPETNIKLYNENSTSGTTAGLSIYMNQEASTGAGGTRNCYADIVGTDIIGDLPAFGFLSFTTVFSSSDVVAGGLVGIYSQIGRTASGGAFFSETSDTGTGDSAASGAFLTTTASSAGSVTITVSPSFTPSGIYRILARVDAVTDGTYRIVPFVSKKFGTVENLDSIYLTRSAATWRFPVVPLGITDIGLYTATIGPPIIPYVTVGYVAYLPGNLNSDFIMYAPADCVRDYLINPTTAFNFTVNDDTYEDTLTSYSNPAGTDYNYNAISSTGNNKILIQPGINQTMYFTANPWGRNNYITAALRVRPRRSTL